VSRFRFAPAGPDDDAALRERMAADWLRGNLSVSFRREPSYFAGCALQGEQAQVYKCFDADARQLVGMGARITTPVYVNGELRRVGLLSDLRLAPEHRGGTLVARGYKVVRQLHEADPVPFYLTAILDGNRTALASIASGRAGLPSYRDWGRMLTPAIHLDLPKPALAVAGVLFRRAVAADAGALGELCASAGRRRQFARPLLPLPPGLDWGDFLVAEQGSRLTACLATWDQHALRQTHIEAYSPWLAALRPLYNAAARALPIKPLPAPGARIPYLYFAALALREDDVALLRGLVRHAYRALRAGPWHYAIASLHERDPLAAVLDEYRAIRAAGRLFVVHYEDGADAVARIDARCPYVDMARL
jgi:hypothetical protein